jgi:hypothetical protein
MFTTDVLARLDQHQAAVAAIVKGESALLAGEAPSDPCALARARWRLARALSEYQLFKHREIFDPALRAGDPGRRRVAAAMKARCEAADAAFRDHARRWSSTGVTDRWPEYQASALAVARTLQAHLAEERRQVATLI